MHARFPALTALLALAAVHAVSGQTCTFTCPPTDSGNFKVGPAPSDANGILTCNYPAMPAAGDDVNGGADGFSCQYSKGQLTKDDNGGFCPAKAVSSCDAPAPAPAPATKPAPPTKTPPTKSAPAARDLNEVKMMKKRLPVQGEDLA